MKRKFFNQQSVGVFFVGKVKKGKRTTYEIYNTSSGSLSNQSRYWAEDQNMKFVYALSKPNLFSNLSWKKSFDIVDQANQEVPSERISESQMVQQLSDLFGSEMG